MSEADARGGGRERDGPGNIADLLRALPVFPPGLPQFDPRSVPADPVSLFWTWLRDAVRDQVPGPQAMVVATADDAGRVSSRVLLCKDVDEAGRWYFASSAGSVKGRELAVNPRAALTFYWPQQGRQVRVRGTAAPAGRQASAADFLALSPASRAEALDGHQSQPLDGLNELDAALRRAQARISADPSLVAAAWTLYAVPAEDVEFWQADTRRRHIRVQYQRTADGWKHRLLWP